MMGHALKFGGVCSPSGPLRNYAAAGGRSDGPEKTTIINVVLVILDCGLYVKATNVCGMTVSSTAVPLLISID